jgi:hypothetical protein
MKNRKRCTVQAARTAACALAFLAAAVLPLSAQDDEDAPADFTAISPIFGQLVAFTQPAGFVPVFEQPTADRYIREAVPKGETAERWTQMITVTGAKGVAADPRASPEAFALAIVGGFKRACPETFSSAVLSRDPVDEHDAFAVVASCGTVGPEGAARSETALIVAIAGTEDYYTVQWAERGAADDALDIGEDTWRDRLDQLSPISLCPIVPGEKAPYPSCVGAD